MNDVGRRRAAPDYSLEGDKVMLALGLMGEALDLIDANHGPHDAGALLDQAMCRLRDYIDGRSSEPANS